MLSISYLDWLHKYYKWVFEIMLRGVSDKVTPQLLFQVIKSKLSAKVREFNVDKVNKIKLYASTCLDCVGTRKFTITSLHISVGSTCIFTLHQETIFQASDISITLWNNTVIMKETYKYMKKTSKYEYNYNNTIMFGHGHHFGIR